MADATITIGADATQAKATLEQLKQITDELFNGLNVAPEKAAAAQAQLITQFQALGLSTLEANDAAAKLKPQLEGVAQSGDSASINIKSLTKSMFGFGSVIGIVIQNLRGIQDGLAPVIGQMEEFAVKAGASEAAVDLFGNSVEMLIKPTTAAKNIIENFKIAWAEFERGAGLSTDATVKFGTEMERVAAQLDKMRAATAKETQELSDRAAAVAIQVNAERSRGEVTDGTRKAVAELIKEYEKGDISIPPKLIRAAALVGVLTEAQEDAAKAAEKSSDASEKAADKQEKAAKKAQEAADKKAAALAAETAELEKQFSAEAKLLPKLMEFAEGKKAGTAAIDDAVRALKEEISLLEQEAKAAEDAAKSAQGKLQDASKRRAELEGKSVLSVEEAEELLDLQLQTSQLQADAANTAEDAAQATFEYGQASSELAGSLDDSGRAGDYAAEVYSRLEDATNDLNTAIAGAGSEAADFSDVVMTDVVRGSNMAGDAIEDDFIGPVKRSEQLITNFTNTVSDAGESFNGFADEASGVAQAAPAAADGIAQVGDELRNLPDDKDDTGLGKAKSDSEALANTLLPRILELCKEIRKEAGGITLGGGGAGI